VVGAGGCSVAAKLSYRYGAGNVVVLDVAEVKTIFSFVAIDEVLICETLLETLLSTSLYIIRRWHENS
jgi:hypothetical protein